MRSIKNSFLVTLCLLFGSTVVLQAQDFIQIKGLVVDEKTGDHIPYATVRVKGAPVGTITDLGGKFSFWISKGYSQRTIVFSSVGYFSKEVSVTSLIEGTDNRIALKENVRALGAVTVIGEKQLTALEVLKKSVKRIPENYNNEQHTFDAYYRELVTENGAVIKYADGVVTFDQSPYDGKKYRRENYGGQQLERKGSWIGGYSGIYRIGDRLHDHFGHKTADTDRVLIHEARASLNHSRERFMPSIEAGPLATLSKDLVKYLRHFIAPGNYGAYNYELAEIPDGEGEWDYLIRFKPRKPASELTGDESIVGGGIRKHVLTGEIYIDQKTFVIKKLNYRIGPEYRSHICSLGFMQIIHYGYEVSANYGTYNNKWQLKDLKRVDEFLFPDTVTSKITPFSAISQIQVTRNNSDLPAVPDTLSFRNKNHNYFHDYHRPYHPEFWEEYEEQFPQARISDSLKRHMEDRMSLEAQFALRSERNSHLKPPEAQVRKRTVEFMGRKLEDDYGWLDDKEQLASDNGISEYHKLESEYAANYVRPLGKVKDDLWLELEAVASRYERQDTAGVLLFEKWSQFKSRSAGKRIYKQSKQYKVKTLRVTDQSNSGPVVSMVYIGENSDKSLSKRPLLVKVIGTQKTGARMRFDTSLMPLLKRGVVIAYVHLKQADESGFSWYRDRNLRQRRTDIDDFVKAVTYLKMNKLGDPAKMFFEARDAGAAIVAAAVNLRPDLCQGIFFHSILGDPISLLRDSAENKALNHRKEDLISTLDSQAPYHNITVQSYPNMAFFNANSSSEQHQPLKMLARLRALKTDENLLLLMDAMQDQKDPVRNIALQYTLLFQWLEDLRQKNLRP